MIIPMKVVVARYLWLWMGALTRGKISCLYSLAWPRNQEGGYSEFS